jgi:hypothetical protein
MLLKPVYIDLQIDVLCYLTELEVLEMIYMYIYKLNYKIRRVWLKSKVFVRNQVITYRFKMIILYNRPII